jgi:hypothetical protein
MNSGYSIFGDDKNIRMEIKYKSVTTANVAIVNYLKGLRKPLESSEDRDPERSKYAPPKES